MSESFLARLPMGGDLLGAITEEFKKRNMPKAGFNLIGALTEAEIGYYDLAERKYFNRKFEGALEIVSCTGNVSHRDGEIFVHGHVVLSDEDFRCMGGHLMEGCRIFAAELCGFPITGAVPKRVYDEPTGLFLWAGED
jgi:hypothetical protein